MAFIVAVVGCAVRRVSAPGIALANAQMGQLVAAVYVAVSGRALPPGIGLGNAQMGQLVAGTAAAGGWQIADGRWRGARGRAGGGWWGDWHPRTKLAALRATRLLPAPLCRYFRPSEQHPPEEAPAG